MSTGRRWRARSAAGDVRHGSLQRVAAGVGEGTVGADLARWHLEGQSEPARRVAPVAVFPGRAAGASRPGS